MTITGVTIAGLTAQEVYRAVDASADTVRAMVRAEKYGSAIAHGARITHHGYADGATEFSAATALYRVTF
jgi:hypothetical protein